MRGCWAKLAHGCIQKQYLFRGALIGSVLGAFCADILVLD